VISHINLKQKLHISICPKRFSFKDTGRTSACLNEDGEVNNSTSAKKDFTESVFKDNIDSGIVRCLIRLATPF